MKTPTIYCTNDYDLFKFTDKNRSINNRHVSSLARSFKKNFYLHLNPITVNKDFEILSGQHRYLAAKKCGFEIYYVIAQEGEDNINSILTLNWDQRRCSVDDALAFHADVNNNEHFKELKEIKEKAKIHTGALYALTGAPVTFRYSDKIVDGTLKLKCEISELQHRADKFIWIREVFREAGCKIMQAINTTPFIRAFSYIYEQDPNWILFEDKIRKHYDLLKYRKTYDDFVVDLVSIYNKNLVKNRIKLPQSKVTTGALMGL